MEGSRAGVEERDLASGARTPGRGRQVPDHESEEPETLPPSTTVKLRWRRTGATSPRPRVKNVEPLR